jgi:hypothetical protein
MVEISEGSSLQKNAGWCRKDFCKDGPASRRTLLEELPLLDRSSDSRR